MLVANLLVVGFHHKKGHQIEFSYPLAKDDLDDRWSNVLSYALPDGAHNRDKDLIYFHFPLNGETLFGVAAYRQIDANSVTNKEADVTRNSIQKSVCVLLRQPLYGRVSEELQLLTEKYFEEKDFTRTTHFEEFVTKLNGAAPTFDLKDFAARDFFVQYKRKSLVLFKLLLLQKKVLFMSSPIETLVKSILTLVSLVPELLSHGLYECTSIGEKALLPRSLSLNSTEDIVFDRNVSQQLDFDRIKLKTDEDDASSMASVDRSADDKPNLLKRATSITSRLTDTFSRLTTTNNTTSLPSNFSQDLPPLEHLNFPLQLFNKNNLLHPYLSLNDLDVLHDKHVTSYVIGASNALFRQQTCHDVIVVEPDEDLIIPSAQLKAELQLTTADLRFLQTFEEENNVLKSEEDIRRLFVQYLLALMAVAQTPNDEAMNDFNAPFVKSFQATEAFRLWQSKGPYPHFDQIIPRHPQAGQLNVTDVKLRVAHVLDDTEAGRKLKGAFEDTSQFMGEKSRAATKVLGQAKNSIFSTVMGTFNQGKQWLNKPPTSDDSLH